MATIVNDVVKQQSRYDSNDYQGKLNGTEDEVEGTEHNGYVWVHISNRKITRMVREYVVHVASFDHVGL